MHNQEYKFRIEQMTARFSPLLVAFRSMAAWTRESKVYLMLHLTFNSWIVSSTERIITTKWVSRWVVKKLTRVSSQDRSVKGSGVESLDS